MAIKMQIPPPADIEAEIEEHQKDIKELRSLLRVSQRKHGVPETPPVIADPAADQDAIPDPDPIEADTPPVSENGKRKGASR